MSASSPTPHGFSPQPDPEAPASAVDRRALLGLSLAAAGAALAARDGARGRQDIVIVDGWILSPRDLVRPGTPGA